MAGETPTRLEEEIVEYRQVLGEEVRNHKLSSRLLLLRGFVFLIGGMAMAFASIVPLIAWLLVLGGFLQILNSVYELQREDKLQRKLRHLEDRFGRSRDSRLESRG